MRSRSAVTAYRIEGDRATVWVNNESSTGLAGVLSSNRDTWARTAAGWKLKESVLIAMRSLTPPEVLAEIRKRAGFPAWKDVRITGAAPFVRKRYGNQVYSVVEAPREALGGELFLDLTALPPDSALSRWAAAQKFLSDGIVGR